MTFDYESWLQDVRAALQSINMPMDDWQKAWHFDFQREYRSGINAQTAAVNANRYWWHEQNKSIGQACPKTGDCWLPRNHTGDCQPVKA